MQDVQRSQEVKTSCLQLILGTSLIARVMPGATSAVPAALSLAPLIALPLCHCRLCAARRFVVQMYYGTVAHTVSSRLSRGRQVPIPRRG